MVPENIIGQIFVYLENQIEAENQISILRTIEQNLELTKSDFKFCLLHLKTAKKQVHGFAAQMERYLFSGTI